jgi:hypothetical protein
MVVRDILVATNPEVRESCAESQLRNAVSGRRSNVVGPCHNYSWLDRLGVFQMGPFGLINQVLWTPTVKCIFLSSIQIRRAIIANGGGTTEMTWHAVLHWDPESHCGPATPQ